jgi:RIP metalloprotease RseP
MPENASTAVIKSYLIPTTSFLMEQWFIKNDTNSHPTTVYEVLTGGLWSTMGLQSGDIIISVNTVSVNSLTFKKQLQSHIGQDITFVIKRWEDNLNLTGTCPDTNCMLWVLLDDISATELQVRYQFPLLTASKIALTELYYQAQMTLSKLGSLWASLFSGSAKTIKTEVSGLSGPIWAVKFGDILAQEWLWSQFLAFGAMISFALALFNLLPIPALDGGRRLWVVIQSVFFPKKIEEYFVIEWYINFVFFVLLMGLGVYIMLKDLVMARGFHIPFIG